MKLLRTAALALARALLHDELVALHERAEAAEAERDGLRLLYLRNLGERLWEPQSHQAARRAIN